MRSGWQAGRPGGPWGQAEEQARPEHRGCCVPCRMILSLLLACLAFSCCGLSAPARGWGSCLVMPPRGPPCSSSWGGVVTASRAGPAADTCVFPVLMPVWPHFHLFSCTFTHGCVGTYTHAHEGVIFSLSLDTRAPSVSQDLHGHTHMCTHISIHGSPRHWCVHTACHTHTFPLHLSDASASLHRARSPSSLSAVTTRLRKGTRAPHRRLMAPLLPPPRSESTMSPSRRARPPLGPPSPSPRLR